MDLGMSKKLGTPSYAVGDHVVSGSTYYGLVFAAGPMRFQVVWENGDESRHSQDYRGFRHVVDSDWQGDTDYEHRVKKGLERELTSLRERRRHHGSR